MIEIRKPVVRRVHDPKWGLLAVTLGADCVTIREYGKRTSYGPVSYGFIALQGAKLKAEERRNERAAKRRRPRR
jgi:hypothetical protein